MASFTFVPLFPAPHDLDAAEELREAAAPSAPEPVQVETMPEQGLRFFSCTGEAARELDRCWGERVAPDTRPVVLLLHEEGLRDYLGGLDADFVIGIEGGDGNGLYADCPHVHVVDSSDPLDVTRAAMAPWP